MEETDAVSCALCLRADEYGSMLHVPIMVLGQDELTEKVICRSCASNVKLTQDGSLEAMAAMDQDDEPAKPDQGD